ncbi:copper homeostasis periplasmic binding protein CopC [Rhizobium sp. Root1220]|uniref:copper homeostasis periplasmic binding protein CopC n=1 Tax=Rhizobium sp. Root1220 TaxID=1736432 RepID=UPI0006FDE15E|nr:copper homeostasis periplasmic binding protein CopC [Rhizobium sp. Root1220]KQV70282.1 Cu resistance protein [Rhizobium sp. Root1220]
MPKFYRLLAVSITAGLCFSGQACAHAHLTTSAPAENAVTTSPAELDLRFSEELNVKFSGVKIIGPDKSEIKAGDARLMDEGKTLSIPISGTLNAGAYTVEWYVLSTDGHKTDGSYRFTVKP